MIFRYVNVFVDKEKLTKNRVCGNRACVAIIDNNKTFPSNEEIRQIAIEKSKATTIFVKRFCNNIFDIKYFFPNGKKIDFCGHGTLAVAKVITKIFNLNYQQLIFNIDTFNQNIIINHKEGDLFSIETLVLPTINYKTDLFVQNKDLILKAFYGLIEDDLIEAYKCRVLNDYVFFIKNAKILRKIKINPYYFLELNKVINFRLLTLTAQSFEEKFDYEARTFCNCLKNYEDIANGSSSCYLSKLWSQKLNKTKLCALFPYRVSKKYYGGVVYSELCGGKELKISGYVKGFNENRIVIKDSNN